VRKDCHGSDRGRDRSHVDALQRQKRRRCQRESQCKKQERGKSADPPASRAGCRDRCEQAGRESAGRQRQRPPRSEPRTEVRPELGHRIEVQRRVVGLDEGWPLGRLVQRLMLNDACGQAVNDRLALVELLWNHDRGVARRKRGGRKHPEQDGQNADGDQACADGGSRSNRRLRRGRREDQALLDLECAPHLLLPSVPAESATVHCQDRGLPNSPRTASERLAAQLHRFSRCRL